MKNGKWTLFRVHYSACKSVVKSDTYEFSSLVELGIFLGHSFARDLVRGVVSAFVGLKVDIDGVIYVADISEHGGVINKKPITEHKKLPHTY